ncbi:unnamed protein product [Tenebrio molitor]|nr:unnamed protein product [Tenebrio molitor]
MSFRNHKDFADAQGRIRDLSLVISRRPWQEQTFFFCPVFFLSNCTMLHHTKTETNTN